MAKATKPVTKSAAKAAKKPVTKAPAKAVKQPVARAVRPAAAEPSKFTFGELFQFTQAYSRGRYWAVRLSVLAAVVVVYVILTMGAMINPVVGLLYIPLGLVGTWIAFVTIIKRLRDCDASLYFALLNFVPLVNLITFVVFGCIGSTPTKNTKSGTGIVVTAAVIYVLFGILLPILAVAAYMVYNQQHAQAVAAESHMLPPPGEAVTGATYTPDYATPTPEAGMAPAPEPAPAPMAAPAN